MKNNNWIVVLCFLVSVLSIHVYAAVTLPTIPTTQFIITDYGATTSSLNNAPAINAAISAANAAGGGTVVIPANANSFLSGPITMKSNVNLYLSAGSVLRLMPYGTGNGAQTGSYPNNGTVDNYDNFIFGQNLTNIEVSGKGTIEGDGAAWWAAFDAPNSTVKRPCMIRFKACNTVLVTDVTLQNSPGVHLTYGLSGSSKGANGTISNVTIKAPSDSPNTDAVDLWYWDGVDIINCNFSVGDDNVAIDSYSKNINIKNCTFGTGHGVSVGSYTSNVSNVTVDNCTFEGTTNGFRLKSNRTRGGNDASFSYSNVTMNNIKYPFYITGWYDKEPYPAASQAAATVTENTPIWNDITFKNITVTNAANVGIIYGLPEAHVNNVVFDNVQITTTSTGKGLIANYVDELKFINCSSISGQKGNAIISNPSTTTGTPYLADITGINLVSGVSTSCSLGVHDVSPEAMGICFPNPVKGNYFTASAVSNIEKVLIYNLIGEKVKEQKGNDSKELQVNMEGLLTGNYIVKIILDNGTVNAIKLIKD